MKNSTNAQLYQMAFDLYKEGKFVDAIEEFKRIEVELSDPKKACALMIGMIYYHELNDPKRALPFAKKATEQKPLSELASINLVHCLMDTHSKSDVNEEVRRYLATGRKVDYYQTLFDENQITVDDFKKAEPAASDNVANAPSLSSTVRQKKL